MDKFQIFCLLGAAGIFITLAVVPVSAETVTGDDTVLESNNGEINLTEYSTASYNETEGIETELGLGFKFLKSMLSLLDLNLNLINETLTEHSKEYPFLRPTIEGTNKGTGAVDSAIVYVDDPTNMSKADDTMHSFDGSISDLNESLVYPRTCSTLQMRPSGSLKRLHR